MITEREELRKASKAQAARSESERLSLEKKAARPRKLSKSEQKELDQMESKILKAEEALEAAQLKIQDPTVASNADKLAEACAAMEEQQRVVEALYERWKELEALK